MTSDLTDGRLTLEGSVLCFVDWGEVACRLLTGGGGGDNSFALEVDLTYVCIKL